MLTLDDVQGKNEMLVCIVQDLAHFTDTAFSRTKGSQMISAGRV